eukprot:jgi/Tetstr1/426536/TSEL_016834.t1
MSRLVAPSLGVLLQATSGSAAATEAPPPAEDLEVVKDVDITVGSALDIFGGDLPYSQVVEWHEAQKQLAAQP